MINLSEIPNFLRAHDGPLTSQLAQESSALGLGLLPRHLAPEQTASMICGYCSTGCSLDVHLRKGKPVNLSASPGYPVNLGMACPKGWEALTPLAASDRATTPLLRNERGQLEPCDWDRAMVIFSGRMKEIIGAHGGGGAAWLGTGQIPSEELAFLGALARFGLGIRHGDGNTRQCMATAVSAYKECFGFDAPPYTYADLETSDVMLFFGSNPCIAHPILWQRAMRNRHQPDILVIDPRHTETAAAATAHYALQPKSDLTLLYTLANLLIRMGAADNQFIADHTSGYEVFRNFTSHFDVGSCAESTGLAVGAIEDLALRIARGRRVSFWWTMGVNQGHQSTRTAQAIIALALLTGNIGRPGTGANSITGQCNAMGSRLFSNSSSLYAGRDFGNPAHRQEVADILCMDASVIPDSPGYAYDQILDAIDRGEIRALWVVATNPAHSWIDSGRMATLRKKLDFLVVQDMYATTETARMADLVLPAAAWGEKDGTFINSERRIASIRQVSRAPGQALTDFRIFQLIAAYSGCGSLFSRWTSPQAVFQIMKELSAGRPCDITGIDGYSELDECGGIQWPLPSGCADDHQPERRLFEDGKFFTDDQRARFVFEKPRSMPEPVDADFPFLLLTGRGTSAQWHTNTRTGKSDVLRKLHPSRPYCEINPDDARALNLDPGGRVCIESRRGSTTADVMVTAAVTCGQVFLPMHDPGTNRLTLTHVDPISRQPAYKACAVKLRPA